MATKKATPAKSGAKKIASPAKKAAPPKKAVPIKKGSPAKKVEASKKTAPVKKAAAKKVIQSKKAVPSKKSALVKKVAPAKKAIPAKKVTPTKKATTPKPLPKPVKKAAPGKKVAAPTKKTSPVKKSSNNKSVAPKAVPSKKTTPVNKTTPSKKSIPTKKVSPVKSATVKKLPPKKDIKPVKNIKKEEVIIKPTKPQVKDIKQVKESPKKAIGDKKGGVGKLVDKTPFPIKKELKPIKTIDSKQLQELENSFDNQAKKEYLKEKRNMQPETPSLPVQTVVVRYPDTELEEFKLIIEDKLEKAKFQYENLMEQIKEITENTSGDFTKDLTDFSSSQSEVEMLNAMATRQRTYISDLQNALVRIRNKTYGICAVTGELIDKKRLIAVPTTTKSVLAKQHGENAAAIAAAVQAPVRRDLEEDDETEETKKKKPSETKKPVIITKVIKKPSSSPKGSKKIDDDDDELDEILKDLDSFTEGPEETFDADLDIGNDEEDTGYDEPYEEADDDEN